MVKGRYGYSPPHKRYETIPLVRYADDFVFVAKTEKEAKEAKSYIGRVLKVVGVELSDEKTHITEISDGFDFLGFTIRKFKSNRVETLLTKPSEENMRKVIQKLQETFDSAYETGRSNDELIRMLNLIIRGWANYYRHFVAKNAFRYIADRVWKMTWKHLLRKYPTRNKKWIKNLHMTKVRGDQWIFYDKDTDNKLLRMNRIPIKRFIKVKSDVRVYDGNATEYWEKRELSKTRDKIYGSPTIDRLFVKQKGRCAYCNQIFRDDISDIHKHHLRPRSEGGDWKLGNLRLLHSECHTSLHSLFSRKDMARLADNKIDYLRLLKPQS
jgi:RNA-directed DNA polymerase